MRPEERDPGALWDMVHYAKLALRIADGKTEQDLSSDETSGMAIERAIAVIGEAANNVSDEFKAQHPEIPWRSIRGQRNVIVHMYRRIDYAQLWQTIATDLPEMVRVIEPQIPSAPS
jgi:uncharacterized protein with HEPN domain